MVAPHQGFIAAKPKGAAPTPVADGMVPKRNGEVRMPSVDPQLHGAVKPRKAPQRGLKPLSDLDAIENITDILAGIPRKRRRRIMQIVARATE
jgi:hypothetical protein